MKFKAELKPIIRPTWAVHLIIPDKVATHFKKAGIKRIIVKINQSVEYPAAFIPTGKGNFFVNVNKEIRKKLDVDVGDKVEVEIVEDKSKYGMPMPEEFQELLYQDIEGDKLFHDLTPGRQRSLLHIIGKPKSMDIRIRKGLIILNHLKAHNGKIDYLTLNQDFKDGKDIF